MIQTFMKTIISEGLMGYNLSPPVAYQDELPGEMLTTLLFNPNLDLNKATERMNNVNVEIFPSKRAER